MLATVTRCASYPVADITLFQEATLKVATETGCILFQLPTRGLLVYTFQVPLQWQNCSQEETTL